MSDCSFKNTQHNLIVVFSLYIGDNIKELFSSPKLVREVQKFQSKSPTSFTPQKNTLHYSILFSIWMYNRPLIKLIEWTKQHSWIKQNKGNKQPNRQEIVAQICMLLLLQLLLAIQKLPSAFANVMCYCCFLRFVWTWRSRNAKHGQKLWYY